MHHHPLPFPQTNHRLPPPSLPLSKARLTGPLHVRGRGKRWDGRPLASVVRCRHYFKHPTLLFLPGSYFLSRCAPAAVPVFQPFPTRCRQEPRAPDFIQVTWAAELDRLSLPPRTQGWGWRCGSQLEQRWRLVLQRHRTHGSPSGFVLARRRRRRRYLVAASDDGCGRHTLLGWYCAVALSYLRL